MHNRIFTLAIALLALTACGSTSSEYSLISMELPGAEGAELDEDNERVYTGMDHVVCDAHAELGVTDKEVYGTELPAVLDVKGSSVLFVDGGTIQILDYETGVTTSVPDGGDVSDAQLTDDGVAILDGCEVRFASGAVAGIPGRDCTGELIAGDGLMVRIDDDGVYQVTPERVTRIGDAHSLAWDALNRMWLMAERDEVLGWTDQDGLVLSHDHNRQVLDVFPLSGMVGFRDVSGRVFELSPDGGRASDIYWLGVEGRIVGSISPDTLAISNGGLTVLTFQ